MCKVLYRGQEIYHHEWIEGSNVRLDYNDVPQLVEANINDYMVIPKTVGQYTGINDKNDKKIFEGDIVKDIKGDIYVVTWASRTAMFRCVCIGQTCPHGDNRNFDANLAPKAYTIIGNIHDNPELLEV